MTALPVHLKQTYLSLFSAFVFANLHGKSRVKLNTPADTSVKIVARYGREGGITNGALHNIRALQSLGYKIDRVDVSAAIRNPTQHVSCPAGGWWIFHCDATQFPLFAWPLRRNFTAGRIVGYFAWELAAPPSQWPNRNVLWDEIWTPSRFAAASLAQHYTCPIHVVPHVVLNEGTPRIWRKGETPLTFLTMADARSSLIRKNPRGTITAFQTAFPGERDVRLIVKLQAGRVSQELSALRAQVEGDSRITLICETLDRAAIVNLFRSAHVYVSLHRAEGFGLPLLEARTFGLATIATDYSGNLDFMTADDSLLVPYRLVTMRDDEGVYGTVTWADPDIHAAAGAMRRLYESPALFSQIATRGWQASQSQSQLTQFAKALDIAGLAKAPRAP